jgi:hypothetical protein
MADMVMLFVIYCDVVGLCALVVAQLSAHLQYMTNNITNLKLKSDPSVANMLSEAKASCLAITLAVCLK